MEIRSRDPLTVDVDVPDHLYVGQDPVDVVVWLVCRESGRLGV